VQRRLFTLLAGAACVASLLVPAAAGASSTPPPQTKIVGGSQASPGQFPWVAALIQNGYSTRGDGFRCGATVLSHTWALTAAHCVLDYDDAYPDSRYGNYVAPSFYSVLTGTTSLYQDGGGQRLQVARIYPHPAYSYTSNRNDFALLRLADPTNAPSISVIGSSASERALDDPGTIQTTIGWGLTDENASSIPPYQRYVQVPVQSDATCSSAYPASGAKEGLIYYSSSMICAGPWEGGKDSCSGDSGGPLATQAGDGSWRQTGVVSFGLGCAEPTSPGVYSRLTSAADWISQTRKYGPFDADGVAFITRQYLDFVGKKPTSQQIINRLDQMKSNPPAALINDLENSANWDALGGMVTRLYSAAFLRNPDTNGLSHWITSRLQGHGPIAIASNFSGSHEFQTRYGTLSDSGYVDLIYQNIFGRAPDTNGKDYWLKRLAHGTSRGQMLYELSNSNEYRRKTADTVRVITTRFGLLRQAPTAGEITSGKAMTERELIDLLRTSVTYAKRF
jgi:secreted trypsin-like serine protease